MENLGIGLELVIVLATAITGGILAKLLRLPVIMGYLAAGVAIGPYGFGLVSDRDTIFVIANIGVILLLFTVGLEFSLKELRNIGKVAVLGGLCQMLVTTLVITAAVQILKFPLVEAVLFGIIISESSTAVILRLTTERGDTETRHGRIMVSLSLVQDLSVVPLVAVLPVLGTGEIGTGLIIPVLTVLGKALLFLVVLLAIGWYALPWLLGRVTRLNSREIFLLAVIAMCFATAFGSDYFGLSAPFGAFVAGLLISQSAFARQALADIIPLRDAFSTLFFVSLGMFFSISFVLNNWMDLLIAVPLILAVKIVLAGLVVWFFGSSIKTSLLVGMGLIPVGEISFILAQVGFEAGVFSEYQHSLIVAMACITILVSPLVLSFGSWFYTRLSQTKLLYKVMARRIDPDFATEKLELSRHAVICGFGRTGKRLAQVLERQKFPYLVIDLDPVIINQLRAKGVPCIYGDASNPVILSHASLARSRILVCAIPDYVAVELVIKNALAINPKMDIIARVHRDEDAEDRKSVV